MRMWSLRGGTIKGALRLLGLGAALVLVALAAADLGSGSGSLAAEGCTITLSPGESIQQAIDDAPPGAVICLEEGTWEENLVIGKSVTLRGAGPGNTVIQSIVKHLAVAWIEGSGIEVILEGLTITGARGHCLDRPDRCPIGLVAKGSAQVTLQDSQVSDNEGHGLYVEDSAQVTLQNSQVLGNGDGGLYVLDSARVSLTNCQVSGNGDDGLEVRGSVQVSLQDSQVSGNGGRGLWVNGHAQVSLIDSKVSGNGGHGLLAWDHAQVTLKNSQVSGNGGDGLYMEYATQMSLQDCEVSGNGGNGLKVGYFCISLVSLQLQGCQVSNNEGHGLSVEGYARVEVRESRFLENAGCGIAARWGQVEGTPNEMRGNRAADLCGNVPPSLRKPLVPQTDRTRLSVPEDYATVQEAVDAIAPGGTITIAEGTYTGGVTLWKPVTLKGAGREATVLQTQEGQGPVISVPLGVQEVRLEKLTVRESESDGLWTYGQAHLEELQVSGNGGNGLVVAGSAQVNLQNSEVSDNGKYGLYVGDSAQVNLINSKVSDNEDRGLYVVDSAQVSLTNCQVSGNEQDGLFVGGSGLVTVAGCLIEGNATVPYCKEEGWICGGIVVEDEPHVELTDTTIRNNTGWGIAAWLRKCGGGCDDFTSTVLWEDRGNRIYGNGKGDVCLP